jgi:hypothetical protein
MSRPNTFKKGLPTYKNAIMRAPEIRVALIDLMPPIFSFKDIKSGIDPTTSITANRVNVTVMSWSN